MKFILTYHEKVVKEDIPKLDRSTKDRIKKSIEAKLLTAPEKFGKPLRRSLKGYRKLRVGDYRIVFLIENEYIKIIAIKHRREVYKKIQK